MATTSSTTVTPVESSKIIKYTVQDNILHDYASYTYGLSLHAVPPQEYNELMIRTKKTGSGHYVPKNVLIASAGRNNAASFTRNAEFTDDFYIEDLKMTTTAGNTTYSRGTNAIDISFTIIEPYGVTLLERLITMAKKLGCDNHASMPYMLQIDFYGYKDDGKPEKIADISKYIPIQLTGMRIKISTKGAEYDITCAPYGHQAFSESVVSTPANFEIKASTVQQFFESISINPLVVTKSNEHSFPVALNHWLKDLYDTKKQQSYDEVRFVIDDSIANAIITPPELQPAKDGVMGNTNTPASKNNSGAAKNSNVKESAGGKANFATPNVTPGTIKYPVSAGKSIVDVISEVVRNSSFIRDQIKGTKDIKVSDDAQELLKTNKKDALVWFQIVPEIELGTKFDTGRNTYPKKITFYITPYTVFNVPIPEAPQGDPGGAVKEYNYIFSGKNKDVLEFTLDFNSLYFVAHTAVVENANKGNQTAKADETSKGKKAAAATTTTTDNTNRALAPSRVNVASQSQNNAAQDSKAVIINDIHRNLLEAATELITVDLKIIGDPDFIKQDDIFYGPKYLDALATANTPSNQKQRTENGSIIMDRGQVHARLQFKTPGDYNEQGLVIPDKKYVTSSFSGLYQIITVNSEFSGGKFVQTLHLVRINYQANLDTASSPNNDKDSVVQRNKT